MKHIINTLAFYVKYQGWQGYAKDRQTKQAIKSLQKRGYLEVNEFNQARHTGKIFDKE